MAQRRRTAQKRRTSSPRRRTSQARRTSPRRRTSSARRASQKRRTSQKKRTVINVAPNRAGGGWDVKQHGKKQPVSSHRTKAMAVKRGRQIAKRSAPGQVKIFSRNGKIQASHKYEK